MCLSTLVQVYYWVFRNLGDIENPLTSLGVKYRPLKIRATATAHVRVSFESETSYLFPLNVLVSWKQVKDRPARTTFLWLRRIIKCLRVNFCSNKHVFQRFTSFVGIMIGGLLKVVFSRGWFSIRLQFAINVTPSQENGSFTLMTFSPFGTVTEKTWNFLFYWFIFIYFF